MRHLFAAIFLLLALNGWGQTIPHTCFMAPRWDGKAGNGTYTDPYNCSTPERLAKSWTSATTVNTGFRKIVFMPGVYFADTKMTVPSGMHNVTLMGYGATLVAKLPDQAANWMFFEFPGNNACVVEGFDFDCGSRVVRRTDTFFHVTALSCTGTGFVIRNCAIRNILAVHADATTEAFGIFMNTQNGICSNNRILPVSVPHGTGNIRALVAMGKNNNIIANTIRMGDTSRTDTIKTVAFTIYGSEMTLSGNACVDVDVGLGMDAASGNVDAAWEDNVIVGNQLVATDQSVRIYNSTQKYLNWTFVGNVFKADNQWLYLTGDAGYAANKVTGFSFVGNRFVVGTAMTVGNIYLGKYDQHTFYGNGFGMTPVYNAQAGVPAPNVHGMGNNVAGTPDDAFCGVK